MGKMAMDDPTESLFAIPTQHMQQYGCILGIHAWTIVQARINGDFIRDLDDSSKMGMYRQLPSEMRKSLVRYAASTASEMRKEARDVSDMQAETKQQDKEVLMKQNLLPHKFSMQVC